MALDAHWWNVPLNQAEALGVPVSNQRSAAVVRAAARARKRAFRRSGHPKAFHSPVLLLIGAQPVE